jgi:N-acyl-D-aspartate/D-glutamate deacylase
MPRIYACLPAASARSRLSVAGVAADHDQPLALILRRGTVVDGYGGAQRTADLGDTGDGILFVGSSRGFVGASGEQTAKHVIDATCLLS